MNTAIAIITAWLMFNAALYIALGRQGSIRVSRETMDRFRRAVSRVRA